MKIYCPPKHRGKLPYWYREERDGFQWKTIIWLVVVIACLGVSFFMVRHR